MSMTVRLPGLTMNGLPDSDGDTFRVYDVEGLDSPEISSNLSKLSIDGVVPDYGRYDQRELLIRGNAWGPFTNEAAIWRVRRKIETALSTMVYNLATTYFDVSSPGISYQMDCRHLGKLHFPTPNATVQLFEIPLTAPDPRKYFQSLITTPINTASAVVTNAGNYYASPVATLLANGSVLWLQNSTVGSYTRLTINTTGLSGGILPVGSTIDFAKHQLNVAGVGVRDLINMPRTWWSIGPGDNTIQVSGNWSLAFRSTDI